MAEGRYSTTARTVLGVGSTRAGWWVEGGVRRGGGEREPSESMILYCEQRSRQKRFCWFLLLLMTGRGNCQCVSQCHDRVNDNKLLHQEGN